MRVQRSFLDDVPPKIIDRMTQQFIDIIRRIGPRLDIQPESAYNRLLVRSYHYHHPRTEPLLERIRSFETLEEAKVFFANWFVNPETPALETIARGLRSAKEYLRARGELDREAGKPERRY